MSNKKIVSIREAFGKELVEQAKKNKKITVISCDLKSACKLEEFFKKFPNRSFEIGIAEANAIGIAAGISFQGFRPFVVSFGSFISGKNTEIRNTISYNNAPVVIVGTHSGLIGSDGATQSALQDIAIMSSLEGFEVFQPCSELDTKLILKYVCNSKKPVYLRISRNEINEFLPKKYKFHVGKPFEIIKAKNKQILVVSSGAMVSNCYNAIQNLKANHIGLLNISSIKPLNKKSVINILKKYKKIIVVEDHYIYGGLGSIISEIIASAQLNTKFINHGLKEGFINSDIPENLEKIYKLDVKSLEKIFK